MYIIDVEEAHKAWANWKSICNKIGFKMEGNMYNQIVTSTLNVHGTDMVVTLTDFAIIIEYGDSQRVIEFEFEAEEAIEIASVFKKNILNRKVLLRLNKTIISDILSLR